MTSILDGRPALAREVENVAEVAGYLWQKGWAERNGGNITVNVTEHVDDEIRRMPAIGDRVELGCVLPNLEGCYFFCKGTNKRMRDLARRPMENGSFIRIVDGGDAYEIIADALVKPTSELPSHLAMHNYLLGKGLDYKAALHTHPIELVAMSHTSKFLEKDVLTDLLWSMIPETKAFCPRGLGIVLWEKHGVCAVGCDIMEAFDQVDVLSKSAQIYINAKCMGYEPDGMSKEQMREMTLAFDLPK